MKEATGELNMTVIVIVAIAAIAALFYVFIWPAIQTQLMTNTCRATYGDNYNAVKSDTAYRAEGAEVEEWQCCPEGSAFGAASCKVLDA